MIRPAARHGDFGHRLAQAGAALALAAGAAAALGWLLPWPLLATFGAGRVPMGPAAALLFILYGVIVLVAAQPAIRAHNPYWLKLAVAIVLAISIGLLISSSQGPQPSADAWRQAVQQSPGQASWRHLSPLTALGFVLVGGSTLLALIPAARRKPWQLFIGTCSAGLVTITNGVFAANQLSGVTLAYLGTVILPALPTALAFTVLGSGLLALGAHDTRLITRKPDGTHNPRPGLALFVLFVLCAISLFGMGALYLRHLELAQRALIQNELDAVSSLKVGELASWRAERLADAVALSRNTVLGDLVQRSLADPADLPARQQLHDWLQGLLDSGSYDHVLLTDLQLVPRRSLPAETVAPAAASELAVALSHDVSFIDFHYEPPVVAGKTTGVHLELAIALHSRQSGNAPVALLSLRIDPYHFLFPFIRRWPTEQTTGETLLVRREGDEVVFLNDVRFRENTTLGLRLNALTTDLPAAWAVSGHEGAIYGRDYRGMPVIAHARAVPGSPWFLITKIDAAEAMAPILTPFLLTTGLTGALLLVCALAVGLLWRQQNLRTAWALANSAKHDLIERQRSDQALRLSNQRFRDLVDSTEGIVWEADASTFRFTSVSANAERMLGYPVADWLQPGFWAAHIHSDDRDQAVGYCTACTGRCEDHEFEYRFLAADGREVWLRDTVKIVKDDHGKPLWLRGLMIDISAYKQASRALQASLQDKTALLREVHHRVKNNLQVITSLLRLEARRCQQPEAQLALNDMQARIHSMALLHETLYRSGTFAAIDLGDYLSKLATQAFRSQLTRPGGIELVLDLASVPVSMDQALPCGLLVNELLSNCLKHGFPEGRAGKISIELQPVAGGTALQLRVSDNGVGLPADFDRSRHQSLGLQLADDLAGQLQGTLDIGPLPAAVFTLRFNIDPHTPQVLQP